MAHTKITTLGLFLAGFVGFSIADITTCPSKEKTITTVDGSQFAICPNSDYQADTVKQYDAIISNSACALLCDQYAGCAKAVFDKTNYSCYLKGHPEASHVKWVTNDQFESIRFVSKPEQGSAVTSCPYGEKKITSSGGSQFKLCPNTDFEGSSSKITSSVSSINDCAKLCAQTTDCSQAVYDSTGLVCYIKDKSQTMHWVFDTKYETIQFVSKLADGDVITACPYGEQNITSSGGVGYAICPNSDYQGTSIAIVGDISSGVFCAGECDRRDECKEAVYDSTSSTCYIKDGTASRWTYSNTVSSIRFVNGTSSSGPQYKGKWSDVINLPVIPVGAFIVPEQPESSRMLVYSSWGAEDFSGPTGVTQFADYNFVTGAVSAREVANTKHDMFCPGMSSLMDGRLVISGGENAEATSYYDPVANTFVKGPAMNLPRGYQSSTTLSNGKVFTIGGSFTGDLGGKTGEILDADAGTWTTLPGADVTPMLTKDVEGIYREDNHAWLYGWTDGYVFQAGPSKTMHWYGTGGKGSVVEAGVRDADNDAMCAINVMYDTGKILSAGGSQDYTDSKATASAHIITINKPLEAATVEKLPDMNWARGFANAVVLPDGKVLITGGQTRSLVFTDVQAVLVPEIFDPVSKNFTQLAPQAVPRNYHSVSLLLADGTVFSGGGGMCPVAYKASDAFCDKTISHPNGEIFSPPYLFNDDGTAAERPHIFDLSSSSSHTGVDAPIGGTLTVAMNDASGTTFSLIRIGSATHSVNTDQRRISLTNVVADKAKYTITLPSDAGVLIPGYYYLFAISSKGVPSMARTVRIHF